MVTDAETALLEVLVGMRLRRTRAPTTGRPLRVTRVCTRVGNPLLYTPPPPSHTCDQERVKPKQ